MNNSRVFHVSGRFSLKHSQVVKGVDNCALAWVVFGESFRNLTPDEAIKARNQQAKEREPLPFAELPGLVFRAPAGKESALYAERAMAIQANQFVRFTAQA